MTFSTVFFQMLSLLLMIGAGWLAVKTDMLDEHTNAKLSKMILNIFNPMLMISSAAGAVGQISLQTMGQLVLIAAGMFAFFIVVGMVLTPFFEKDAMQRNIYQLMFVFSNLGFIGIPVVSNVLGPEYVAYLTEFILVYAIVFYTYGITVMEGHFSLSSLRAMVNPGNLSNVLAVLILVFGLRLPGFIMTAVSSLGNITSPAALICVGYAVAHADLKKIFASGRLYLFAAVKLVALPLLMLPLLRLVTNDPAILAVSMILFGMPVGNMPMMLATEKGIDNTTCSAAIILTTLLCVVTIPVLMGFVI